MGENPSDAEVLTEAAAPVPLPDAPGAGGATPEDGAGPRWKLSPKAGADWIDLGLTLSGPSNGLGTVSRETPVRATVTPQEAVDLALRLLEEARAMHDAAAVWFAAMSTAKAELEAKGHFFTAPENAAHEASEGA